MSGTGKRDVEVRRIDQVEISGSDHCVEDAIFREIVRLRDEGRAAALATVIGVRGSAPAREPMKILVRSDGTTLGSVGGGCLEEEVKRVALRVLEEDRTARFSMSLTEQDSPAGGLICGGSVEVFVEPITAPPLVLFGGGHVGHATASLAARVGFRILVTDDRPEYASKERFPMAARTVLELPEVAARELAIEEATFVLVMTRSHDDDRRILLELARRDVRPRYLGMIGSSTKIRLTRSALEAEGVDPGWMRLIRTPVGLSLGARTADEIAVSIVAEMIAVRRGLGAVRWSLEPGGEPGPT